jgi:7-cyano-7-deazaguanine reductase
MRKRSGSASGPTSARPSGKGGPVLSGVGVKVLGPDLFDQEPIHELDGLSLDRLDIECTRYTPAPDLLRAALDEQPVSEVLVSNLLKSNCLVTGQPDWAACRSVTAGRRSTRKACCNTS